MLRRLTCISPVVSVAVFPVRMSTSWPDVSSASKFLIRRFSFFNWSTEKAIAIEMTRGMPSGMQTISKAIAVEPSSRAFRIDQLSTSLYSLVMTRISQTSVNTIREAMHVMYAYVPTISDKILSLA